MNLSLFRALACRFLSGKVSFLKGAHIPQAGHVVPRDFVGVGVATSEDPATDPYLLDCLQKLGIRNVRVDFTYGDETGPAGRLLESLLNANYQVLLHLVQPFAVARGMAEPEVQTAWRSFVGSTLARFGPRLSAVEIGATINRRRWSGYDAAGFFSAWAGGHEQAKRFGVRLAGPNITDFEPLYNISILCRLSEAGQLPNIHTNNLFSERVTEPEYFDLRIFGPLLSPRLKANLVKKACFLKKITTDFGIPDLVSPSAFWTLPRIQRQLQDEEQIQASYLTRYLVLCAASGALRQAFWGPLVCQREGLIDDGTTGYPEVERVTHYAGVSGSLEHYRLRPAFHALTTFIRNIPGALYEGPLATAEGVEIHAFRSSRHSLHVLWTMNGKAIPLAPWYRGQDLEQARGLGRDGEALAELPDLITESPIYLCWPETATIAVTTPDIRSLRLSLHRYSADNQPYFFQEEGWRGVILAESREQAAALRGLLHPERLPEPTPENLLRRSRNTVWTILDPCHPEPRWVIKKPRLVPFYKRVTDRFKPSKARRSWNAAAELLRRGIGTARPVAFFERADDRTLTRNYFICDYVEADFSARQLFSSFASGQKEFMGVSEREAYRQLGAFFLKMHGRGVFFRDLSGGNILIRKREAGALEFSLIDINRARFFANPITLSRRLADLTRVCTKLHWKGREAFVGQYLKALGRNFTPRCRIPFYLYDMKSWIKHYLGRKPLTRLFTRGRAKD